MIAIVAAIAGAEAARAQPGAPIDRTAAAVAAAEAGDWPTVERLLTPVVADAHARRSDRAVAHRLLGLAALERQDSAAADAHFLAYLKLDLDGRLDPAIYPPETIAFFEDVRGRHAAELRALRPSPKRSIALNLIPPAGQFQNGDRGKAWTIAVVGGLGLTANLTSYALLRSWCSDDGTCSHTETARALRDINIGTAVLVGSLYIYGVWDGLRHFKQRPTVMVAPVALVGGAAIGISVTY